MTIKIGDAAVGQEFLIMGQRYKITRYVRPGERADELQVGRGDSKDWGEPETWPRYILEKPSEPGKFYHYDHQKTMRDLKAMEKAK